MNEPINFSVENHFEGFIMKKAFTLIELLIVVAIIAILAAIAVPNFLEAQVRAKVSRCKSDMRNLANALESYFVDQNKYVTESFPVMGSLNESERSARGFKWLTTPIAYITAIPLDPFTMKTTRWGKPGAYWWYNWMERNGGSLWPFTPASYPDYPWIWGSWAWGIWGMGPDAIANGYLPYDSTNGTVSAGDILRLGPGGKFTN